MLHRGQRKTKTFNLFSSENVTTLKRCTIYISLTLGAMIAVGLVWEVLYYCNKGIRRLSSKFANKLLLIFLAHLKEQFSCFVYYENGHSFSYTVFN